MRIPRLMQTPMSEAHRFGHHEVTKYLRDTIVETGKKKTDRAVAMEIRTVENGRN